jgi:hypothetical protein
VDADDGTIDGQVDGEAEFDHSKFDQVIKELDEEIGSEPGSGDEDEGVATTVDDEIVEDPAANGEHHFTAPMGKRWPMNDKQAAELATWCKALGDEQLQNLRSGAPTLRECIVWMDNLSSQTDATFKWMLEELM